MGPVIVERSVRASIDDVWADLTDPDRLATWFWPPSFGTTASIDLVTGGRWRISATTPAMAVGGIVRRVVAPTKLALTWHWRGDDYESDVTIVLIDEGGTTRVEVTHHGLRDEQARSDHEQGWADCLGRLAP